MGRRMKAGWRSVTLIPTLLQLNLTRKDLESYRQLPHHATAQSVLHYFKSTYYKTSSLSMGSLSFEPLLTQIGSAFADALISWKVKKQSSLTLTLVSHICELQWLRYLLDDLHISFDAPISTYCDNGSAIHL
ncbi:hypothetical protein CR513_33351, partial [Mucuna pruriens]